MMGKIDLTGQTVFLAEDDELIRHDVAGTLRLYGADVITTGQVAEAMEMAEREIDHAVLDVRLEDGDVHPVARRLHERGIPFTFHSSAARCSGLTASFPEAKVLSKPAMPMQLASTIQAASLAKTKVMEVV